MAKTFFYVLSLCYCIGVTLSSLTLSPENCDDETVGSGSLSYKKVDEDQFWNKYGDHVAGGSKKENVYALPVPVSLSASGTGGVQKNFQELKKEADNFVHKESERVSLGQFPTFASESGSIHGLDSSRLETEIYQRPSVPETHISSSGYEMSKEQKYHEEKKVSSYGKPVVSGGYIMVGQNEADLNYNSGGQISKVIPVVKAQDSYNSGYTQSVKNNYYQQPISVPVYSVPAQPVASSSYQFESKKHYSSSSGDQNHGDVENLCGINPCGVQPVITPQRVLAPVAPIVQSSYHKNVKQEESKMVVNGGHAPTITVFETKPIKYTSHGDFSGNSYHSGSYSVPVVSSGSSSNFQSIGINSGDYVAPVVNSGSFSSGSNSDFHSSGYSGSHFGGEPVSISYVAPVVPVISSGSYSGGKSDSFHSGSLSAPVVTLPMSGSGGSSYSYHSSGSSYHSSGSYGGGSSGLSGGSRLIIQPGVSCSSACDVDSNIGPSKKVYGLSTSYSSKYENNNGKVNEERHAAVKVNDNGKVDTYETHNK